MPDKIMYINPNTTISLRRETKRKLENERLTIKETFDSVLTRLLKKKRNKSTK